MAKLYNIVHWYDQLARTVSGMLALARARQWGRLPEMDTQCSTILGRLKTLDPHEALSAEDRERALALMHGIRSDQDELAALIRPQMTSLVRKIDELQKKHKLDATYGAQS